MNLLLKFSNNLSTTRYLSQSRYLSLYPTLRLKEIKEVQEGKELVIFGEKKPSDRVPYLLENKHPSVCPLCASGLDVKHTDVLILSQFVRSDGCMLPKRITGLCQTQQRKMSALVTMAQKAGLMPNLNPASSKKDPKRRYQWKKYNKYFDETTIKCK